MANQAMGFASLNPSYGRTTTFFRSLRLDVGPLHVVEVLALDADQLARAVAPRRMHVVHVIEMLVARVHHIGAQRLDQGRLVAGARLDDLPVGHLGGLLRLAVDRPALAVVVRLAMRRAVIDVAADAEAELRILVEHLARIAALGPGLEMGGDKPRVLERALDVAAGGKLAAAARISRERGADVGGELVEGIARKGLGHRLPPWAASGSSLSHSRAAF